MPNELKNALKASTSHVASNHTMSRQLPVAGSSTVSVMVWTISGIVLASCGGGGGGGAGGSGLSVAGGGSNGGGGGPTSSGPTGRIARVVDGPVKDAAVYFDIDGDGEVSDSERAEQTQNNRPMYITDANGYVNAPIKYEGHFFIANVDNATDTATGDTLSGEYQSLSTGGIATPITDLITDQIGASGSDADAQGVLDDIFGTDGLVTVADIRDAEKYKIQEYDVPKPTLPSDPTDAQRAQYNRDITKYKTSVIMKSSLALSEIDKDEAFTNLESSTARVDALSQIFDDDPNNGDSALMERIDARVDAGREILGISKPLAQPDSSISPINEDSVFRFPQNSEDIFGFDDPNGNSDDAAASRFTGIYVKSSVDFSQDGDAHTVDLLYNGSPLSRHEGAGSDSLPGNLPPEAGFYYVSSENLSRLSISPSRDDSGTLEVEYYVFDGEQWSDKASLEITVSPVDDLPTAVAVGAQDLTAIDENTDLTGGMKVADLDVTDADGAPHGLVVGGTNAAFFRIRNDDELWLVEGATLDFETTPTLTVHAEVAGANPAVRTGNITVTVNNVNDNLPMIEQLGSQIPLLEGTFSVDTNTRYRYTASDADGGTSRLTLSGDPRERFQIDTNGNLQIKANSEFDYENPDDSSITLTITAADSGVGSGNQPISTTETVTIRLRNINDNPPVITQSGRQVPLDEGTFSSDTNTGYSYTVSDADGVTSTLSVSGDLQNRFAIDASGNLQIKAGSEFNYETPADRAITLTITATDSGVGPGSPAVTDTETVIITFGDVNEAPTATPRVGISTNDHTAYALEAVDFGFRDVDADDLDDQFYSVIITSLPGAGQGTLALNGTSVRVGDAITFTDINNGQLIYMPMEQQEGGQPYNAQIGYRVLDDGDGSGTNSLSSDVATLAIRVGSNQSATGVAVGTQHLTAIDENTDLTAGMKVADLDVTDADGPPHRLEVRGDNTGFFKIRNEDELWLVVDTGETLDYETTPTLAVQVGVSGASPAVRTGDINVTVNNVNDNPPIIEQLGSQISLNEGTFPNTPTNTGYRYTASDADGGTSTLIVSGDPQNRFAIDASGNLQIKAGSKFNYESLDEGAITLIITATDSGVGAGTQTATDTETVTITFEDVNEAPTATPRAGLLTNDHRAYTLEAVDFGFRDVDADDIDDQFYSVIITSLPGAAQGRLLLNGASVRVGDAITFAQIDAGEFIYTPNEVQEGGQPYNAEIGYRVQDDGDGDGTNSLSSDVATLAIRVGVNQPATAVSVIVQGRVADIDENTDLKGGMKVADLDVTDTDGAPHRLVLSGANAGLFAIRNDDELWLVEGTTLDYETTPTLTVQVEVSGAPAINTGAITVAVNNVNEAPTATPRVGISTTDDVAYTLEAVDFGFRDVDADDIDDQFHSVIITSLPGQGQGTLELNGVSVSINTPITLTDINNGRLIYMPMEQQEGGQPYNAQIGYRVLDDGDGSGANSLSSDVATLAIRVGVNQSATAVSVIAQGRVTDIDENTDLTGGVKVADLDVTDTDGAPHRLTLSGANAGLFAIRNDDELWLVEGATLDFETTPTLTVQVEVFGAPAINTGAITVRLNNVNEAPTATPRVGISTNDNRPDALQVADFGFSDVDADDSQFHSVIITSLPGQGQGTLELNGNPVSINTPITFTDINNGRLVYTPNEVQEGGQPYNAQIGYRVQDDGDGDGTNSLSSGAATLAIRVVGVNQSATAVSVIAQGRVTDINENTDLTSGMKVADLDVTDTDGAPHRLVLSGANAGLFAIRNDDELWLVEGATLDFETTPTLTVQVEVFGAPAINTGAITVRLNNVNEAPTATPKVGISTNDNLPDALQVADFGFSDVDADDSQFHSVIITSLPGQGTLELNDVSVSVGDEITFTDINNGRLVYTPNEVQEGEQPYNAQIGYRVQDDGDGDGTNSLSSGVATLAIRVVGANQATTTVSVMRQGRVTAIDENTDLTGGMKVADLNVTGTDSALHRLVLSGDNAGLFAIRNDDELWLVEGATLDFETTPTLTVQVEFFGAPAINTGAITVRVNNVNDNTPVIERTGTQRTLDEGTFSVDTNTMYRYTASDADGGTLSLSVSGDPQDRFQIDPASGNLQIKAGSTFDYETPADRSITLTITAADSGVGSGNQPADATETVTIEFYNLNDSPTVIEQLGAQMPFDEGTFSIDTNTGYSYTVSDADNPHPGLLIPRVSGDALDRFQLDVDGNLQIKAGSSFDYEIPEDRTINLGITARHTTETVTITFSDVSTEINIDSGDADFSIAIDGSLVTGAVLTATEITPDPDIDDAVYSYQWYHIGAGTDGADVDIAGATSKSYTIADTDEGKRIGVRVSYEEDSLQSDGRTPTGTEIITAELPIADFTEIRDISPEVIYRVDLSKVRARISTEETSDRLILREFGGNDRSVFDITDPHRSTDSRYVYGISGVDKDHFMFVQDGSRISIVSKTGFNYENPTDSNQDNNYQFTLTSNVLGTRPISYTLTIVDDISEARVKTATASIIETSSSIKFTSLEDAVRAYSGIDDALLRHSATFGGAVVDNANPHRATVTFEVAGQADIVFAYELSGDDVNDVLLVQDGNDVSLITVAGLDYKNPADEDGMSTYSVVETITTTSPNLPSTHRVVSTTYTLNVTDKASEVSIEVYENHPLYKPLEIDSVDLQGDLQGYQLTEGYVDNALFTIDRNGEVWWRSVPNYEAPRDNDGDNLYEIELYRTNSIGQMDRVQVDIRVKDIGINPPPEEDYSSMFFLLPEDIADEHLPSDFVQHLILGNTWKVPATGPVIIQYSIDTDSISTLYNNNQLDISRFHSILDAALLSSEQAANLKFIEVAHREEDDDTPYINIEVERVLFSNVNFFLDEGRATITYGVQIESLDDRVAVHTIPHELGHALGLNHPFEESGIYFTGPGTDWPGNEEYLNSPLSVIAYNVNVPTFQPADIEALQFLYGAPGTNFMGVESIMAESRFASRLAVEAQDLNEIDENTNLAAGMKVADITVTDTDLGAFGTLEIVGDHAEFFEIRNGLELWLALQEGESLESIAALEVYVRIAEKHAVRTGDITITVNDATEPLVIEVERNQSATSVAVGTRFLTAIDENTVTTGMKVTDLTITDADGAPHRLVVGGTNAAFFEIRNEDELWLMLQEGQLDYETTPALTVHVEVAGANPAVRTGNITVTVNNVNDNPPMIEPLGSQIPLNEGTFPNTPTNTGYRYTASDADGGTSTLSLSGDDRFQLDASGKLQIKAGAEFDYETPADRAITLTITATDSGAGSGNPPAAATHEVTITFGDANDAPTATPRVGISTSDDTAYTLEAVDFGFSDVDADDSQFHSVIITSLPAQDQGTLELNGVSVSINTPITFTDINNGRLVYTPNEVQEGEQPYNAQIGYRVLDDGDGAGGNSLSSATETLVIAVEQSQSATGVTVGTQHLTAIDENTDLTGGMKVADLTVTGADGPPPHRLEVRGDNTGFFEIRNEDELWLVVNTDETLDYETTPALTVQVGVAGASDITPVNITVAVNNLNDNPPVITEFGAQIPLNEGLYSIDTDTGYRYTASDADGGTSTLSFLDPSFVPIDYRDEFGANQERFQIDTNGNLQIKAGSTFDYEIQADRSITLVTATTDSGEGAVGKSTPRMIDTKIVTITFGDVNEAPTAIPRAGISTNDDTAYALEAVDFGFSDVDAGDSQFHSVIITSLPGQGQGTLELNGTSVSINTPITFTDITNGQLIYMPSAVQEGGQPYNAQIGYRVLDDGDAGGVNKLSSATGTLVIAVRGSVSATGVAVGTQHLTAIDENTDLTAGMKVADLTVTGADGGLDVGGVHAEFFEIRNDDELWLVLQEGQTLDFETTPTLTVQVEVSGAPAISTNPITVAVNNVNDNTPVIERTGTQRTLDEGTFSVDTNTMYRYTASDADGGTLSLSVSGDPQDRFQIDPASGNLQIKAGSTFDYETPADRSITLTITAADSGVGSGNQPADATETVTIEFYNLNDSPTVIEQLGAQMPFDEGTFSIDTNTGYSYTVSDADDLHQAALLIPRVSGDALDRFQLDVDGNLQIKAGSSFDYEIPEDRTINLGITARHTTETVTITFSDVSTEINIDSGDADFSIAIDGSLVTGAVLTATEITPDPDIDDAVYRYQWYHIGAGTDGADVDISGATSKSYTIADTDEDKRIGVRVSYEEDSFQSDGTTPTDTETITAELPIADFTEMRDISSEVIYPEFQNSNADARISTEETSDRLILREFGGNDRNVFDITNPHRATDSRYVYGISGVDKDHFMFVQNGSRISIVSKTGFNYENPTDSNQDNHYEFTLASNVLGVRPIPYTLTIVDDISEARVKTATASIMETSSSIKFTSLEDAVRAYSGIDDALLEVSATFGGAVVDGANPHRATVTFEVAGQADIVFAYELSGDDVSDVLLVQDGNDVSLITVAGLDYENPADKDGMSTYSVVETITTTSPNIPSAHRDVQTTYTLSVTDKPSEVSIEVYENHPLYKPLEIDSVDLQGDLQGYQLTEGYVDNALFTIDRNGEVRWRSVPNYEAPRDNDGDNTYRIELSRTNSGETDRVQVDIRVKDIGIDPPLEEDYSPIFFLLPEDIADEDLPSDFVQHLILGETWKVPATGPVIIQYSIDTDQIASRYNNNQLDISRFHSLLDAALLSSEQAANLKFIEVAHREDDDDTPYINIELVDHAFSDVLFFTDEGRATINYGADDVGSHRIYDYGAQHVFPHELGHALGLGHPFQESKRGNDGPGLAWPGDEDYLRSPLSVMAYNQDVHTFQPADIEALQFLYGAPGTNFMGVESIMAESRFASRLAVEAQDLNEIDENTNLTAGMKVADITVTDTDLGAFGTLEIVGDHAEFFEIRNGLELWLALQEGESLENIAALEVYVRIAEKHAVRTGDITITVNDASSSEAMGSSGLVGATGGSGQIKIDEMVNEGQSVIANLIDLDLGEIDLTEITVGGGDKDQVQIRQTQNGGVLEFVSAPDFEAPEDDDEDNVYEITLHDDLTSIEVDVTVIDIPEL